MGGTEPHKKILWLASWYPNQEDFFTGDFIQRHAHAAATLHHIFVLHVRASHTIVKPVEEVIKQHEMLTEHIIYYKPLKGFLNIFYKHQIWFSLHKKAIKSYIQKNGLPHAAHVHVAWKAGLVALWLKYAYKIPYLVTEHWGMYNRIVRDNFYTKPFAVRYLIKNIFKESRSLVSVSRFLANSIEQWLPKQQIFLIPNVVDTKFFYKQTQKNDVFTFIHVSNGADVKNIKGILNAFKLVADQMDKQNIQLLIVGIKDQKWEAYAHQLGISDIVHFKGEVTYAEVATFMRASHCLILNSFIENSPCVIGEAHCCGLPVIATAVGGIPELINEQNGILIQPNDDEALSKAILNVFENKKVFDRPCIAEKAISTYSYSAIAEQFSAIYTSIL